MNRGKYLFSFSLRDIFVLRDILSSEEAVRAAGRLPIHFVGRYDVVGAAQTLLTNVLLMEDNIFTSFVLNRVL